MNPFATNPPFTTSRDFSPKGTAFRIFFSSSKVHHSVLWERRQCFLNETPLYDSKYIIPHTKPVIGSYNGQKIPRKIFQTSEYPEVPIKMHNAMQTWRDKNPQYEYSYYNREERRNFIVKNFDSGILNCYDFLAPGSLKSDLFKYCILYVNGGIYVDPKIECLEFLDKIINIDDEFIIPYNEGSSVGYWNGLIISTPKHDILKHFIDLIIRSIENKDHINLHSYDIYIDDILNKHKIKRYKFDECQIWHNNMLLAKSKYEGYENDKKFWDSSQDHLCLWENRIVYINDMFFH